MPTTTLGPIAPPAQQPLLTPSDIWRVLRANLWLMILLSVIGAGIGIGLYYWQLKTNPRYVAEGMIIVEPDTRTDPMRGRYALAASGFELGIELQTQARMLLHDSLWSRVIEENPKIRELNWYKSFVNEIAQKKEQNVSPPELAKQDLRGNLRASPLFGTKLLKVSMETSSPDDSQQIVQAIVGAHIAQQQRATYERTAGDLEAARKWKDRYAREMVRVKASMTESMNKVGALSAGSTPMVLSKLNVKEMEIAQLVREHLQTKLAARRMQDQLTALEQTIKEGKEPPQVESAVLVDPMCVNLRNQIVQVDLQLDTVKNRGPADQYYNQLVSNRNALNARLERSEALARSTARNQLLDSMRSQVQSRKAEEDSLEQIIEARKTELGELSMEIANFYSYKTEYDGIEALSKKMDERIALLSEAIRSDVAGVRWQGDPVRPSKPSSPELMSYVPTATFMGLGLALGIAFLREILDSSVRSPRDIARVGPINLLGMVADETADPQLANVPLHLVISQAPHSMMAEQFRQVRTRLQHAASLDTTRTIVITSPSPGDGKSTVACNLAAGLALNGRRILLVDANFRRAELHKLFGVGNDLGFANVLDSVASLESAVQKTNVPNLELLTTGPKAANPTELIESQLFSDFIDRSLEEYDHVIFDTGPLLVVSEAIALAPRVDGVITVVRARKNSRGMLSRVRETLKQIKAEHLGVVLNGVQNWGGGYYGRNIKTYYAYQNDYQNAQ